MRNIDDMLEKCFFKGMSLIEARNFVNLTDNEKDAYEYDFFNKDLFPDDYFNKEQEGNTFFDCQIKEYNYLPKIGIITKDGRIYKTSSLHLDLALWLKFNGIDLQGSLRYVYFPDTKHFSIVEGYGYYKEKDSKSIDEVAHNWNELHESENLDYNLLLTEAQVLTIFKLAKYFNLDFENIMYYNEGFCFDQQKNKSDEKKKIGRYNKLTIDEAFRRL